MESNRILIQVPSTSDSELKVRMSILRIISWRQSARPESRMLVKHM